MDIGAILNNAVSELARKDLDFLLDEIEIAYRTGIIEVDGVDYLKRSLKIRHNTPQEREYTFSQHNMVVGTVAHNIGYFVPTYVLDNISTSNSHRSIDNLTRYLSGLHAIAM